MPGGIRTFIYNGIAPNEQLEKESIMHERCDNRNVKPLPEWFVGGIFPQTTLPNVEQYA